MDLEGQADIKPEDEFGFWRAEVGITVFWERSMFRIHSSFLPTTLRCPGMQIDALVNPKHHSKVTGVIPLQRDGAYKHLERPGPTAPVRKIILANVAIIDKETEAQRG